MLLRVSRALVVLLVLFLAACGSAEPATPATVATSSPAAVTTPVPPARTAVLPTTTNTPVLDAISIDTVDRVERLHTLSGHSNRVYTLAFSGDGVYVASSSPDRTIRLWDVQSGQEVHTFSISEVGMNDIAFSRDGSLLASADAIWDVESRQVVHTLEQGRRVPAPVAFSPDGSLLAVALADQPIKLWDVASGQEARTFDRQADNVALSIEFSPDGTLLAAGGHLDGTVRLWEVESGRIVRTFAHDTKSNIHGAAFSPDGRLLASAGTEYTARLWDVASGQVVHTLRHGDGLYDVVFSPDGSLLASAGCDRTVKLWDVASGRLLRTLGHDDEVMAVAFSPDGTLLASGGYDNQIYLWGIPLSGGCREGGSSSISEAPAAHPLAAPTGVSTSLAAQSIIAVPQGKPPAIDGTISPGEWDGAAVEPFSDGSQLFLMYGEGYLYLGIRANTPEMIAGNLFIDPGDEIAILHSSAALGTALYEKGADSWQQTQGFVWRCRRTDNGQAAQAERDAFLEEEHWLAANARMGSANELEYKVEMTNETLRLAVIFLRASKPDAKIPWPEALDDDCIKPTPGGLPAQMHFSPDRWATIHIHGGSDR